mmetsp:Transcript_112877/g.329905  ORF Transcript_112877/g.329905 Transcript_112877/m.329905 type:complete len:232 (-) Transcript_112877:9-704(-)
MNHSAALTCEPWRPHPISCRRRRVSTSRREAQRQGRLNNRPCTLPFPVFERSPSGAPGMRRACSEGGGMRCPCCVRQRASLVGPTPLPGLRSGARRAAKFSAPRRARQCRARAPSGEVRLWRWPPRCRRENSKSPVRARVRATWPRPSSVAATLSRASAVDFQSTQHGILPERVWARLPLSPLLRQACHLRLADWRRPHARLSALTGRRAKSPAGERHGSAATHTQSLNRY